MTQPSIDGRPKPIYVWVAMGIAALLFIVGTTLLVVRATAGSAPTPASSVTIKPSTTLLVAVRDLARLETNEMHFEKVIDLTDKQSRFFGLVDATDALLLVASGDVTMGVDLGKMGDGDVAMDDVTKIATITLPAPEIFSTRLDEKRTYVYTRSTSTLAERNETLETRARQEAVTAIEQAAKTQESTDRSKKQAEIELRSLAVALGAKDVHFVWK
ncbi:MAG: DUF4230 domain-containing protein [Polyangiaceae bacterium]